MGIRPLKEALEEPEKRIIIQALQAFNWNRQETARVLDINRTTLYKKMKKYDLLIDEPIWVNEQRVRGRMSGPIAPALVLVRHPLDPWPQLLMMSRTVLPAGIIGRTCSW